MLKVGDIGLLDAADPAKIVPSSRNQHPKRYENIKDKNISQTSENIGLCRVDSSENPSDVKIIKSSIETIDEHFRAVPR